MGPVQAVQALRVLRALKPLRLLTRSAGMRLVFKSVVLSLGAMAHVSVLCIMFLLIFAILGVQLFSGRLYRCATRYLACTAIATRLACTAFIGLEALACSCNHPNRLRFARP